MQVVRVGPLPDRAIDAAAAFHAEVLPQLDPARHGGGAPASERDLETSASPAVPLSHHSGEDLALVFPPAPYDHRGWRLAAVQDLARAAAPKRVNGVVGDDEHAIAATIAWLEQARGVTGQLLAVQSD